MTQSIFIAHLFGLVILFQAHMEIYAWEKKKSAQRANAMQTRRNSIGQLYHRI